MKQLYKMINVIAHCALRTHRRTWGISQRELADLLGMESRAHVSRIERGKRSPTLETALACSTLFGVPLGELFPQLAIVSGERLRERISRLDRDIIDITNPQELRKRELFDRALTDSDKEVSAHDV
ncbi:MAG: helix-turn-helix transcriptional regulator [Rubrivivax sp.]